MEDIQTMAVDENWDVILIGAGQNNFALGTYLGMAGLETVICESRLENGGRLFSEEITLPGYWHNSLAYFQDNRELSPVWRELDWENGHHAEFVTPPVISSLLLPDGASVSHHQNLDDTLASVARHSAEDAAVWKDVHQRLTQSSAISSSPRTTRRPKPKAVAGADRQPIRRGRTSCACRA